MREMTYRLISIGLKGLAFGGEYLVRGSVTIARGRDVSPLPIGLTLSPIGTSKPDLGTSVRPRSRGSTDGQCSPATLALVVVTAAGSRRTAARAR